MIGVYLYDIFGASAGNKSSHPKDESNSITNQRNLIMEYIKSDAVLSTYTVREYIDDGISGTRFDREAFEEMMTQVKEGNIQVIITKDYSRLGRDYLEVGRYLEFVFPVLKVRYISVNDNYDSNNFTGATGGMEVAVKNVINMMYSRDASKKVRSARTTLAKAGKFIGPQAPYGYKRSESDKQKLVIDEEPAELLSKMETFDLQCLVAIDLKIDDFKPEYMGKMDFYLEALDRDIKKPHENPSVGMILCKNADTDVVEYSLSRSLSQTMIAEYKTKLIDKSILQRKLAELYDIAEEEVKNSQQD